MGVSEMPEYRWPPENDSPSWASAVVALAGTALLFASAFLAMTRVRSADLGVNREADRPAAVVHLAPPPPPPVARPRTDAARPAPRRMPAPVLPSRPTTAQPVISAPSVPSAPASSLPRTDSTANARATANAGQARSLTELRPRIFPPPPAAPRMLGAPPEPAGVTIHNKKLTIQQMDSIDNATVAAIAQYARTHPMTPREQEAASQGPHPPPLQNGPAGDMRRGMVPVVGASIDAPFLSPGPSPAQRKRNAAIDSEYQSRLHRLENRMLLGRDSIRADSLRRDSLARAKQRP